MIVELTKYIVVVGMAIIAWQDEKMFRALVVLLLAMIRIDPITIILKKWRDKKNV